MQYTVTIRGWNGHPVERSYEAADRDALLAQLAKEGRQVVSVCEGAAASGVRREPLPVARQETASGVRPAPAKSRGVWAGILVVVIAVGVGICFSLRKGEMKPRQVREKAKPAPIAQIVPVVAERPAVTNAPAPTAPRNEFDSEKYPGEKIVSVTTNSGYIIEISQKPNGKRTRHIMEPPSMWESPTDRLLAVALSTSEGQQLPPWPNMGVEMDAKFLEACKKPIRILETDSEQAVGLKKIVMGVREEIKARIENGEHFCDILNEHRDLVNENGLVRANAIRELYEIRKSGDEAGAKRYQNVMNAAFSQMGIAPIGENGETETKTKRPARAGSKGGRME